MTCIIVSSNLCDIVAGVHGVVCMCGLSVCLLCTYVCMSVCMRERHKEILHAQALQ